MPSVTSTRLGERTRKEADTLRENKSFQIETTTQQQKNALF